MQSRLIAYPLISSTPRNRFTVLLGVRDGGVFLPCQRTSTPIALFLIATGSPPINIDVYHRGFDATVFPWRGVLVEGKVHPQQIFIAAHSRQLHKDNSRTKAKFIRCRQRRHVDMAHFTADGAIGHYPARTFCATRTGCKAALASRSVMLCSNGLRAAHTQLSK